MKINFILPGLGDSGGIRVVEKYAELLSKKGIDVIIYSPLWGFNLHRYATRRKNIVHQIYCTVKNVITYMKKEKRTYHWVWKINGKSIREADVTVATMWATAYDVEKLPDVCGKKYYFIQGFEIWDNKERGLESYKLRLSKIVISTWINQQLDKYLRIGPFPVVYNGLDLTKYYNNNKKYKMNEEPLEILMLNHTLQKKGVQYGLKAYEIVKRSGCEISLKMFGSCSRDNLPEYVEYVKNPTQEQLIELYSRADIFLFPSIEEGWGLTPLEAMACQCAVIGTMTGFVLDLGKESENMLISCPKDIERMVGNIKKLISDRDLLYKVSQEGYEMVKKLDWEKSSSEFEMILRTGILH